jgi:hypothetical protein
MVAHMKTPFPARFAFATTLPIASGEVPAQPATAERLLLRASLFGLSVFALAAAALLAA